MITDTEKKQEYSFQLMAWLVLKLLALLRDLLLEWERNYSEVLCWVCTRLALAILRATGLCVRGTRSKWRCLGLEDGAGISDLT